MYLIRNYNSRKTLLLYESTNIHIIQTINATNIIFYTLYLPFFLSIAVNQPNIIFFSYA